MTTLTASEARANLYRLIDQAAESHEPIVISGKRGSAPRSQALLAVLERDPFPNPLPFEKSVGDLVGTYSRRINCISRCLTHRAPSAPDALQTPA